MTPPSERLALHLAVDKAPPGRTRHSPPYPVWSSCSPSAASPFPYVLAEQIEASTAVGA